MLLIVIFLLLFVVDGSIYEEIRKTKARYENDFTQTCSKYRFVSLYAESFKKNVTTTYTRDKTLEFVYYHQEYSTGGLGDRLAGLISAAMFAIRTRRQLVIQGDTAFHSYFKSMMHMQAQATPSRGNANNDSVLTTRRHSSDNSTIYRLHCMNDKSSVGFCQRFHNNPRILDNCEVIEYSGNRCLLCAWLNKHSGESHGQIVNGTVMIDDEIRRFVTDNSSPFAIDDINLYEVAGCLLRMVMSPTEELWNDLMTFVDRLYSNPGSVRTSTGGSISSKGSSSGNSGSKASMFTKLIGIHFRCGDSNLLSTTTTINHGSKPDRFNATTATGFAAMNSGNGNRCIVNLNPSTTSTSVHQQQQQQNTWKGIQFYDDISLDSTIDLANCAAKQFHRLSHSIKSSGSASVVHSSPNLNNHKAYPIAFVTSDSQEVVKQISTLLPFSKVLSSKNEACHIDKKVIFSSTSSRSSSNLPPNSLHHNNKHKDCNSKDTLLQWFLLSLSEAIVTQSGKNIIINEVTESLRSMSTSTNSHLDPQTNGKETVTYSSFTFPISAFSRYASIYGLTNSLSFGLSCHVVDKKTLSHKSHGNWICL